MWYLTLLYSLVLGLSVLTQAQPLPTLSFQAQAVAPPGTAQSAAQAAAQDIVIARSEVDYVLLDVSVKDGSGGYVGGLTKENFQLMDGKKPAEITAFYGTDVPVTVGLVLDNSGSMKDRREQAVLSALALVQASNPKDEVFVVNFNDTVTFPLPPDQAFTDNIQTLRESLLMNPVEGRTALYDAIDQAMNHLNKGRMEKKALVVISDGKDNMSQMTKEEILRRAHSSPVTIYAVGIYDPDQRDKDPGFLKRLAGLTGGVAYFPDKKEELLTVARNIAAEIRNRYTLGFVPHPEGEPGKPQKITVTAKGENGSRLRVHTRPNYIPAGGSVATSKAQ